MLSSIKKKDLLIFTTNQLNLFFNDKKKIKKSEINFCFNLALDRTEYCFNKLKSRYYKKNKQTYFNHLNSDQYSIFLYFFSSTCFIEKVNVKTCNKIYYLNKVLHSVDLFYEIKLPNIFNLIHPMGTVLGRAKYSDFFVAYQNCTVGVSGTEHPTIGKFVTLRPGSSVLGNCVIGNNSEISAGSLILNKKIIKNSIYIGNPKKNYVINNNNKNNAHWIK